MENWGILMSPKFWNTLQKREINLWIFVSQIKFSACKNVQNFGLGPDLYSMMFFFPGGSIYYSRWWHCSGGPIAASIHPSDYVLKNYFWCNCWRQQISARTFWVGTDAAQGLLRLLLHQIETGAGIVALGAALLSVHSCSRFPASAQEARRQMAG